MNRLTYNEPGGKWGIVGMNSENQDEKMYCVACKLLDYEKTELSPDQVEQMKYKLEDCEQELANYKKISEHDIMVINSLRSLYPLQDFEEEAIKNVCSTLRKE